LERPCPSCGTANRATARFCRRCRAPFTQSGEQPQPAPAAYTPRHLAERILSSRSALEGERKQVTVLFADVKGSMDLAEQVDPEVWHRILDRFFAILTEGVHRFEGTINQYTGDGVMALFGAPLAHEDHAQRAAYAALYLRDAIRAYADELRLREGLNFAVRMGMNSGEVVVGKIGDDLRMDYTAQGHTVGLAARMEQLAQPGTVLLTEHTATLIASYFVLRDLGTAAVKGGREPLRIYQLEGLGTLRSRFDISRSRGLSRFVGRAHEIEILEAALARAMAGTGEIVGIVGEAGAGKSRLCYEFAEGCRHRGVEVIATAALPHGKNIPFVQVLQVFRILCGITADDSAEEARRKIAGTLLLRDERFARDLPLLFDFLGVRDPQRPPPRLDPDAQQRQLFGAVRRLIGTRTHGRPAVLIFEDLHWIDAASAAALDSLIESVSHTPTLLVVNFRPEYQPTWTREAPYQEIALQPLGPEAVADLIRELLGDEPALHPLMARIADRTAGNPFFVEEMVRALVDAGVLAGHKGAYQLMRNATEPVLPASVQSVLAARIDRLPEHAKRVLQVGSVIGKEFRERLLLSVLDQPAPAVAGALDVLLSTDFLHPVTLYPEAVYAFKHPLTHEVAYRSQLAEHRARLHAAVARAIEAIEPDRLDEHATWLAEHWEAAGEAVTAAQWHQRAAAWVGSRDRAAMMHHWQRVRTLLADVAQTADTLHLRLLACIQTLHNGLFVGRSEGEAAALFREGTELIDRLGDDESRVWLLCDYAMVQLLGGRPDLGLRYAEEGTALADRLGDRRLRMLSRVSLTWLLVHSSQLHEAVAATEEADQLCEGDVAVGADLLGFSPLGTLLVLRGAALAFLGRFEDSAAALERAIAIGQQRADMEVLNWAHVWYVLRHELAGDAAAALAHARQAVEYGEVAGSAALRATALGALGLALLATGAPRQAVDATSEALAMTRDLAVGSFTEALDLSVLARAHLALGDAQRARDAADRALALVHAPTAHRIEALLAGAQVQLAAGDTAAVQPLLAEARELIARSDARAFASRVDTLQRALRNAAASS